MSIFQASSQDAPLLVLGHGAGAGEQHPWMKRVAGGLRDRGVSVATFDFPYMQAGRRVPDPGPRLEKAFIESFAAALTLYPEARAAFVGGKSMGGRIASQVMARGGFVPTPRGLVCFGYPLHPPGQPEKRRDRHLPNIGHPVLLLQGTGDPFGTPDEMRAVTSEMPDASLELIDGGDHSLMASRRQDPDGRLLEGALDIAARWILARAVPL